ncbi:hypothetical protein [Natrinema hispanicum]|uniref:Uncharacterized protein n=1 Tax=Natrinema hispanicum TaxID=392421 RepID=A0A1G6JP05_9EURY|nr:hypothetical protein [Natrinema hispanicum]SDC20480.1 hypothetical protein SAMN05192552_1002109 [Natrinema hispanicum]SES68317.1 hypothetical protein SAMN04488694_101109 [Natrinema hispanicum]
MFAIDDLSDAIDVTREFLTPVRLWMWLKLALLVFFVGGAGFGSPMSFGGGFGGEPTPGPGADPGTSVDVGEVLPIVIAVVVVVLVVGLIFLFVSSLFEFTLLESLRSGEVHVRRYTKRNVSHGTRLFGFRVALGLVGLVLFGVPVLAIVFSTSETVSLGLIGLLVLLAIPISIAFAIIDRLTTVFVAPTMLKHDLGVVAAWKRFWPTLRGQWTEYVVYLLLVWVLQLVLTVVTGVLFVILLIPFLILLLIPVLGILVLLLGLPVILLGVLLVQVPIVTYLRYYALLVLGDTNADLDLIPDQRAAVRGGGPDRTDGPDGGWNTDSNGPAGDDYGQGDTSDPWGRDESQDRDDTDSSGRDDDTGWGDSSGWDDSDDEDDRWR